MLFFTFGFSNPRSSTYLFNMKLKFSSLFFFVFSVLLTFAQKKKEPQVLVFGSGIIGYSAAVQASLSGVQTLWIVDDDVLVPEFMLRPTGLENLPNVDGGIWLKTLMSIRASAPSDSLARTVKQELNPRLFENAVEKVISQQTNLTIVRSSKIAAINKKRRTWEVILGNRYSYTINCIIDASIDQKLSLFSHKDDNEQKNTKARKLEEFSPSDIRSLVAAGEFHNDIYGVQLADLIHYENNGFFNLAGVSNIIDTVASTAPLRSCIGQALGATAAYLAFFKKESSEIAIRELQTELMNYGARILPYQDLSIDDPNFLAIQRVGLAAVFEAKWQGNLVSFGREDKVINTEIKQIFNQLYSRSQLWFLENNARVDELTLKDALSLIKFVGLRGDEIDREVQRYWSEKFNFSGTYDEDRLLRRYEFMVLLDRYASPYVKKVSQQGNFVF